MAKANRVVIDTSVVRAIGAAPSQSSQPFLDALDAARAGTVRLVKTAELDEEWDKHMPANGLFLEWQADMVSRGRVGRRQLKTLAGLKTRLRKAAPKDVHDAVMKDAHLAAAALETDARVLSLDDKMRGHLRRAADSIPELKDVLWANPATPAEKVPPWLRQGAPHEKKRTLGSWSLPVGP